MIRLALFQPDIPQNTGTMLRLAACLGVGVDLIEPAGFDVSDRHFRRAGLDYLTRAAVARHDDWPAFERAARAAARRLVLCETGGTQAHHDFAFREADTLIMGRESAGSPPHVHAAADAVVTIPMVAAARSLNVATAAALVLGEALRQTAAFPAFPAFPPVAHTLPVPEFLS
jgi:tRNA (cytidine/uridine-2'-O-)-methyltransferase